MPWAAAGAVVGGLLSADGASDAADTQAAASDRATALNQRIYEEGVARQQPFYDTGLAANNRLQNLLLNGGVNTQFQFDANDLYNDPSYAFRLGEGQKAVERSAAARGGLNSGAALKALTRYGQDYASTEYGNAYNRAQNTFNSNLNNLLNPLQSLSGQGQTTAGAIGNAGSNYANAASSLITGQGNAQAASQIAGTNALSNGISGAIGSYNQNQLLSKLLGGSGTGWNSGGSSWGTSGLNNFFYGNGTSGD